MQGVGKGVCVLWLWNEPPYVKESAVVLASVLFTVTLSHLIWTMLIASKWFLLWCTVFSTPTSNPPLMPERKFGYPSSNRQFLAKLTASYKHVRIVFVIISAATFASSSIKLFSFQTVVNVLNSNYFQIQEGLSPNHLKKAKLMFFYTRYPSSNMLKMFFSDVKVSRFSILFTLKTLPEILIGLHILQYLPVKFR